MATRVEITAGNGSTPQTIVQRELTPDEQRRLDDMMAGDTSVSPAQGEMSPAQLRSPAARRAALIQANSDAPAREVIKRVELDGEPEPYFVRVFDGKDIARYEFLNNRLPDGRLDLSDEKKIESWLVSLLVCGVVRGTDDPRPYFILKRGPHDEPMSSAWEWVRSTDPKIRATVQRLRDEVVFHNLDYLNPEAAEEARAALEAAGLDLNTPDPREKKESSLPSGTLSSSAPIDGSEATESTIKLSSSPTSDTDSTEPAATTGAISS